MRIIYYSLFATFFIIMLVYKSNIYKMDDRYMLNLS